VFFGAAVRLHHSFDDPASLVGSENERLALFRRVRDELRVYLADLAQKESSRAG
jgi:arsenate reductase